MWQFESGRENRTKKNIKINIVYRWNTAEVKKP